jgi:hypothetical protein
VIVPLPAVVTAGAGYFVGTRFIGEYSTPNGSSTSLGILWRMPITDGVLWKLPERVVDSIPLLGLEYLLEGSPYNLDTVKQLLQTQKEYDWFNWGHKGYHEVGGVPVQLVGSQYLVQDLPPVTVTSPPGVKGFEVEEEIFAMGTIRSVVFQSSPTVERGRQRVGTVPPSRVI